MMPVTADLLAYLLDMTVNPLLCYQNLILFVSLDLCSKPLSCITRAFTLCLATKKFFMHNLQQNSVKSVSLFKQAVNSDSVSHLSWKLQSYFTFLLLIQKQKLIE